ncbi:hypothetical protein DT075_25565 [Bacillus licheniformis]|nr:hypothetical protein DT075_25565 [Bacillus licheniformis]
MTPNDIGASALHELGNIMAGSYLTALADLTNRQMYPSVPEILREVGNIGAGHSASALALLLNRKIEMEVPFVKLMSFDELVNLFGGADLPVASIFLRMEGDFPGSMWLPKR